MKPTLVKLENIFDKNKSLKAPFKKRLQTTIGWVLNKHPISLEKLITELAMENISTVLRRGKGDVIYGITYVDHKSKTVFNGSDLGVGFSAKAIQEKCNQCNVLKTGNLNSNQVEGLKTELWQQNELPLRSNRQEPGLSGPITFSTPVADHVPY